MTDLFPKKAPTMKAADVIRVLANKHAEDIFIPECKDGPTVFGNHLRMDALAFKISWSKPDVYGYEVKVTRSDFLRDEKWHKYLPYCTHFYFVTPKDLVQPHEVPGSAGLMWVVGGRAIIKKRAEPREVQIPENIFRYILYSRARIIREEIGPDVESRRLFWENWLKTEKVDHRFGMMLRGRIATVVREQILEAQQKNRELENEMSTYRQIQKLLKEAGLENVGYWGMIKPFQELAAKLPEGIERQLDDAIRGLSNLKTVVERVKKGKQE